MKVLLLMLLPVVSSADNEPPSLVFLEYLGLSQEMSEIGINVDSLIFKNNPDSSSETDETDSDTNRKLMEKP